MRTDRKQLNDALATWQMTRGAEQLERFASSLRRPMPDEIKAQLLPLPAQNLDLFRADVADPYFESNMSAYVHGDRSASGIKHKFNDNWTHRHFPHIRAESRLSAATSSLGPVSGIGLDLDSSPCLVAGVCLCSRDGITVKRLRNR